MINMKRTVVKAWDNSQVMGYLIGLKWFNKNGATRQFMCQMNVDNFLKENGLVIID